MDTEKEGKLVEEIAAQFEAFVRENFLIEEDDDFFSRNVNLWEEGYVDSVGVVEVLTYLEDAFDVEIPKDLLFDPKFTSVYGIAERVAALL